MSLLLVLSFYGFLATLNCQVNQVQGNDLKCFRCFRSTCVVDTADKSLCSDAEEFLKVPDLNAFYPSDKECPPSNTPWPSNNADYMETCKSDSSYCGQRVIRVFAEKSTVNFSTSGDFLHRIFQKTSTEFPILHPTGASNYEFTHIVYGCTIPKTDCNAEKISQIKFNQSLPEHNKLIEYQATLLGESDCTRCKENFCNSDLAISNELAPSDEQNLASSNVLSQFLTIVLPMIIMSI